MNCVSPSVKHISPVGKPVSQARERGEWGITGGTDFSFEETGWNRWWKEKGNGRESCFPYKLQLHSNVGPMLYFGTYYFTYISINSKNLVYLPLVYLTLQKYTVITGENLCFDSFDFI